MSRTLAAATARVALAGAVLFAWHVQAQERDPAAAEALFAEGRALMNSERYAEACAKLAKDFADFDEKAKAFHYGRCVRGATYYEIYRRWRHAFDQASDEGCVTFH